MFDIIVNMISNNKLQVAVTELFIRDSRANIFHVITHVYFAIPKNVRLNSIYYLILKILNNESFKK